MQSEPETLTDNSSEELGDVLMVNNPIASLLSCEENIFLCICEVVSIHIGSTRAVDYLQLNILLEDTIHITCQVSLVSTFYDDDSLDTNMQKYE